MIRDLFNMYPDIFKKMVDKLADLNDNFNLAIQIVNNAIHEQFIREKESSK